MMGKNATLQDINLEELVLPANLICEESLSPDDVPEEESAVLSPYRVDTECYTCNRRIRLSVVASTAAIFLFEQLLLQDLNVVCPGCSRQNFNYGRQQQ
ncbi:E7 [Gammapapillomavirus 11]|uniref:Protein E7 n=1 Tax=Gammapapillomavirus 11 TaxID=1513256 RepID=A0A2D2ALL6_9PAPI|nr:E7 [Gammapapillomavirus 11]